MVPQFRDDVILIKARQYTVPVHTLLHYPGYQRLFTRFHSRPQSLLALLTVAQSPTVKRAKRLWGREWRGFRF